MTFIDEVIKRVREHDAARPRSQQVSVGWSEVGGCRAALGFRLDGAWESDETDTWAAQRGTAIHEYAEPIIAGLGPGIRTEVDTIYRGIPGHADIVEPNAIDDIKTTTLANSKLWASDHSLLRPKRVQVHGYAAGLVDAGELPEDCTVRLLVIPVDGTFADWWAYEEPFDRALADEGADRLEWVRERMAAGEPLPKDKPFGWCQSYCLAGETEVVTRDGIRPISELAGATHELLVPAEQKNGITRYGEWSSCEVRSFGSQQLMRVWLRRGTTVKSIDATAEHRWIVRNTPDPRHPSSGQSSTSVVATSDLQKGSRLRSIRRYSVTALQPMPVAIAQGFVYGDGAYGSGDSAAHLMIWDAAPEKMALLQYFVGQPQHRATYGGIRIGMLPNHWKYSPPMRETRSFLLSWLAGYMAADGNVSERGQVTISSARQESIQAARSVAAIVGVGYGPIRSQWRLSRDATEKTELFSVTLRAADLPDWFFICAHHLRRIEQRTATTQKAKDPEWVVERVETTDRFEEVFCAAVPGQEAFALADDLLTHNCSFFSLCRETGQPEGEPITDPELAAAAARYGEINATIGPLEKEKKGLAPVIRGLRGIAGDWRVSTGEPGEDKEALDEAAVFADYQARGEQVPMVTRPGSAPRLTVTKIRQPAAKTSKAAAA